MNCFRLVGLHQCNVLIHALTSMLERVHTHNHIYVPRKGGMNYDTDFVKISFEGLHMYTKQYSVAPYIAISTH